MAGEDNQTGKLIVEPNIIVHLVFMQGVLGLRERGPGFHDRTLSALPDQ